MYVRKTKFIIQIMVMNLNNYIYEHFMMYFSSLFPKTCGCIYLGDPPYFKENKVFLLQTDLTYALFSNAHRQLTNSYCAPYIL